MLGARLHDAQLLFLLGIQRSRQLHEQHAGKADDGVEGCAQLVGHAGQKTVFHQGRVLQLQVLVTQHLLDALALGHIADGAGDKQTLLRLQRAQADLDRELAAVLAQAVQLQPSPHGAGTWFGKKIAPVVRVTGAEALGHQQLDGLAQQLVAAPAEQFHRLRVDEDDVPLAVDDDHGVRRGLQQVLELLVGALAVGDVADGTHHHGALFGVDGAQADLDRKLSTILAQAMQLQPRPHGAGARLAKKAAAVAQVGAAVAVGQQHLHRLPQQFSTGVAKHPLGLGVDEHDAPGHVDHHDRIGGGFEQIAKPRLQQLGVALHLELRDILLARQEVQHLPICIAHGLGRYIDMHQRAVLATTHRLLHRGAQAQGLGTEKVLFVRAALGHDQVEHGAPLHFGL